MSEVSGVGMSQHEVYQSGDGAMLRPSAKPLAKWLGIGVVAVGLVGGGFYLGNNYSLIWPGQWPFVPQVVSNSANGMAGEGLYAQVKSLMQTKYLRANELDEQKMTFGAISGMVAAAGDPYTAFFDPEQNQSSEEQLSGKYSGIGAELGFNADKQVVVVAPIQDTPAEKAGLKAGDMVVAVDGKQTDGLTLTEVVGLIRGEAGTAVTLTVARAGASSTEEIAITRQQITIKTVTLEFKEGNVAYLKLSRFGETTNSEWDAAVSEIVAKGATKMVFDLRNNPGGYLDSAIHIGSEFFKDGTIVGQQDATGKIEEFTADGRGKLTGITVVVLVNKGSASAAEIVSGALQARQRATVIGVTSFGKGTVQQVISLPYNTSLHVTIAKWVLPNDKNIDKQGITPDKKVELSDDDTKAGRDPQLEAALQEVAK